MTEASKPPVFFPQLMNLSEECARIPGVFPLHRVWIWPAARQDDCLVVCEVNFDLMLHLLLQDQDEEARMVHESVPA